MGGMKWTEILLILFVLMLFFGASRIPQLGASLGSAIRNFKKGFSGETDKEDDDEKRLPPTEPNRSVSSTDKSSSKQG